jgi:amidase
MTRTVADAALLYAAMSGRDDADPATATVPGDRVAATTVALPADALRSARLGVARAFFTGNDAVDGLIDRAIAVVKRLGAKIVDPVDLPQPPYNDAELRVLLYELKADLPKSLAAFAPNAPVKTLADVIAFNRNHHERELAWFGQELFEKADALGGLDSKGYLRRTRRMQEGRA